MTELAERSNGLWRPSPGSVYPVLQQLQDEGLVIGEDKDGRRVFALTDAGRQLVADNPAEYHEPWASGGEDAHQQIRELFEGAAGLTMAAREVVRQGTPAQVQQAVGVIHEARRSMYRILAGDDPTAGAQSAWGTPEPGAQAPSDVQDDVPAAPSAPSAPEATDTPDAPDGQSPASGPTA
jgi:DNA-binding PadR family transcriptional regulator